MSASLTFPSFSNLIVEGFLPSALRLRPLVSRQPTLNRKRPSAHIQFSSGLLSSSRVSFPRSVRGFDPSLHTLDFRGDVAASWSTRSARPGKSCAALTGHQGLAAARPTCDYLHKVAPPWGRTSSADWARAGAPARGSRCRPLRNRNWSQSPSTTKKSASRKAK